MSRDTHDRASAVVHEDVVGDPDRQSFLVKGILGVASSEDAVLFDFADVAHFFGFALLGDQLIDFRAKVRILGDHVGDDRVFGRELHGSGAVDGIDAGGEDGDLRSSRPDGAA